jgi:hypothetical protein
LNFLCSDPWERKVLLALLRRYGLRTYRYRRQRHSTVVTRVSVRFVKETLWPEFQQIAKVLATYLDEITTRVIAETIHHDASEATEVNEPRALPTGGA